MGSREKMTEYVEKRASLDAAEAADKACRRRIQMLLDDASFVELDSLAESRGLAFGFERPKVAGDGVVTGYGTINGRLVYVAAQDPSVYGGSIGQMHAVKISKAVQMAVAANVPFIGLYETGGSRIEEGIVGLEALGGLIADLTDASGEIPLLAGVFGSCAGGAALLAGASDFVLMTDEKAGISMNGPLVISAVENKGTDNAASVGNAAVHTEKTGLAAFKAANEAELIGTMKALFNYLPDCADGFTMPAAATDDANRTDTALDDLAAGLDQGYQVRDVIASVLDQGSMLETYSAFATGMVTAFGSLDGSTVGVVANAANRIDADMAAKAIRMVEFCDAFSIPLITITDSEGYVISQQAEEDGLVIAASNLMRSFQQATMPRIGLIIGKAYGTAYLTMNSKSSGADVVYAWPTAEIAALSSDTAAHIVYRKEIAASTDPATARQTFVDKYASEVASPYVAAGLAHVDEVIQPAATRPRLISALNMLTAAY